MVEIAATTGGIHAHPRLILPIRNSSGHYMSKAQEPAFQPAGNYYDKYHTSNPIARKLMQGFLASFERLTDRCTGITTALEVGCGEGELSIRLASRGLTVSGFDISEEVIVEARKRAETAGLSIPFSVMTAQELDPASRSADLVICCEVLEHVEDPNEVLDRLASCAQQWLLVSVPREPLWRALNIARGKYINDLGNTPGHIQHWSKASFLQFLARRVDIVEVASPLPWSMVLCRPRKNL